MGAPPNPILSWRYNRPAQVPVAQFYYYHQSPQSLFNWKTNLEEKKKSFHAFGVLGLQI